MVLDNYTESKKEVGMPTNKVLIGREGSPVCEVTQLSPFQKER